jgi:glycosyltransferase involved in cell wall biosynthesis
VVVSRPNSELQSVRVGAMRLAGGRKLKGIDARVDSTQPLVTVITAVFNGRRCIDGCIQSVLHQDYPNIEHIIMDGGSTDGTVESLGRYDDDVALWRSEPDSGIYDAWNKGLVEASGEWVCFLGADDEFMPNAIAEYMALAAKEPEAEFLSSRVRVEHPSGYVKILGSPWAWKKFSRMMCTPHVGSMHHRSLFNRLGTYDTSYRIVADYEFLLRAGDNLHAAYMPDITVRMRAGGISTTSRALEEAARAKVVTGKRSKVRTVLELFIEKALYPIRPPVRLLLRRLKTPS